MGKNVYYLNPEITGKFEGPCVQDFLVFLAYSHKHIVKYSSTTALLEVGLAINPRSFATHISPSPTIAVQSALS